MSSDKRMYEDFSAGASSIFTTSDKRMTEDEPIVEENKQSSPNANEKFKLNFAMNLTFQNSRSSTGMGNQNNMIASLNKMCYTNMKMCTNMPAFYRSLISKMKDD